MPIISFAIKPTFQKGAVVQLQETGVLVLPNVVPFQYNPSSVKRALKPWNPLEVDQNHRGLQAPTSQPFDPEESITMDIELDASDQLEESDAIATTFGVADRIAALEKMMLAGDSPLGQLLGLITSAITGAPQPPKRKTVPVTFLVWGPGRMVPVRITSYAIEEQMFMPSLYPIQAKVSIAFQVLTPDVFKCQSGPAVDLAIAAYQWYRKQQDALAMLQIARSVTSLALL